MNMAKRSSWAAVAAVALVLGTFHSAVGAEFPNRPITAIIPFAPGGPTDVAGRIVQPKVQEILGQSLVLENRGGATGTIGVNAVVRAAPDGHLLLLTADMPLTTAPALVAAPYDADRDLKVVGLFAEMSLMVMAHPRLGASSLAELVEKIRQSPGRLSFASAGAGSPAHLCIEAIASRSGFEMTHVPYRGGGPAMQALLAGEVDVFCGPVQLGVPMVAAGRVTGLATTGSRRSAKAPAMPTLAEAGFQDLVVANWIGAFVPSATPEPVLAKLTAAFRAAHDDPEVRSKLEGAGFDVSWLTGADARRALAAEADRWRRIIADRKITAN